MKSQVWKKYSTLKEGGYSFEGFVFDSEGKLFDVNAVVCPTCVVHLTAEPIREPASGSWGDLCPGDFCGYPSFEMTFEKVQELIEIVSKHLY